MMLDKINAANKATRDVVEQAERAGVKVNFRDPQGVVIGMRSVPRGIWGRFLAIAKHRSSSDRVMILQANHKVTVGVYGMSITVNCTNTTDALDLYKAVDEYVS